MQLVPQAAAPGKSGEVFALDMGEPVDAATTDRNPGATAAEARRLHLA